jgi:hypothetical protein
LTTASTGAPGIGFAIALLLACSIAWAWLASRRHATELVVTVGGARHRIASYRGGLQYMFVGHWPERARLTVGSFDYDRETEGAWRWHVASGSAAIISATGGQAAAQVSLAIAQTQSQIDILDAQRAATAPSQSLDAKRRQLEAQLFSLFMTRNATLSSQARAAGAPPPGELYVKERTPRSHWQRLGLSRTTGQLIGPDGGTRSYMAVRVAYPWLIPVPLAIVVLSLWRWQRRRWRVARGLCSCCGYDLRASHDRCPECGAPHGQTANAEASHAVDSRGA